MTSEEGWAATLNDSTVCGGETCDFATAVHACLKLPPDGVGVPPLRSEQATYPQRDGVEYFADWYEPRILTFEAAIGNDSCGCSGGARANAAALMDAWDRECDNVELVLRTPCSGDMPELLTNGDFEADEIVLANLSGAVTLQRTTDQAHSPTHSLAMSRDGGGDVVGWWPNNGPGPGEPHYPLDIIKASGWFRASTDPRDCKISIYYYDIDGAELYSVDSGTTADSISDWVYIENQWTTGDPSVAYYRIAYTIEDTGDDEVHYLDDISISADNMPTRELHGPFGIVGRPRVAELNWRRGRSPIADALLRFDSVDQRLYVLSPNGDPGSGGSSVQIEVENFGNPLSPVFDSMYRLDEPATSTDDFAEFGSGGDVEFDGNKAFRGFPPAHYTGISPFVPVGTSTNFPGPTAYIGVGSTDFFEGVGSLDTSFTFMSWFRSSNTPGNTDRMFDFSTPDYYLLTDRYHHNGSEYLFPVDATTLLQDANWHHFAVVSDNGSPVQIFVDGNYMGDLAYAGIIGPATSPRPYIAPVKGFFSEMAFFDTPLSADDIHDIAQVVEETPIDVAGNICAPFVVEFAATTEGLTFPTIVLNNDTYVGVEVHIPNGQSVFLDTATGTAYRQIGDSTIPVTANILGDPFLQLPTGTSGLGFRCKSDTLNSGTAIVSWRPAVISA